MLYPDNNNCVVDEGKECISALRFCPCICLEELSITMDT